MAHDAALEQLAVVGGQDDNGVIQRAVLLQQVEEAADFVVDVGDEFVVHAALLDEHGGVDAGAERAVSLGRGTPAVVEDVNEFVAGAIGAVRRQDVDVEGEGGVKLGRLFGRPVGDVVQHVDGVERVAIAAGQAAREKVGVFGGQPARGDVAVELVDGPQDCLLYTSRCV